MPFNKELNVPLSIDLQIMNDFKKYLKEFDINYNLSGEKELSRLKSKISNSLISINPYSKNISKSNENLFLIYQSKFSLSNLYHNMKSSFQKSSKSEK